MPSSEHELTVELFRAQPTLAAELLRGACGLDLTGSPEVREEANALADMNPATFSADTVFVFTVDAREPQAVIVEVQRSQEKRKRWVWLAYIANLRAKLEILVVLLVVCLDRATAAWARTPLETGHPELVLTPVVADPALLPVITDAEHIAAEPHLATLAALAHRHDRRLRARVLEPYLTTMLAQGDEQYELYAEYVVSGLKKPHRSHWEDFMSQLMENYKDSYRAKWRAVGRAEGEAHGEARGEAQAVLQVLATRGVEVSEAAAERIMSCHDTDRLSNWIAKAVTAKTVDDLFID